MIAAALDGFAALVERCQNAELAAHLAGTAQCLIDLIGYNREPAERRFRENYVARTRAALDEKTFAAFYEQGKTMNFDESVALVKVFDPQVVSGFEAGESEIIIENHSFSRIIIEDDFEN